MLVPQDYAECRVDSITDDSDARAFVRSPDSVFTHNDVPLPMFSRRSGSFPRRGIPVTRASANVARVRPGGTDFSRAPERTPERDTEPKRNQEGRYSGSEREPQWTDTHHATTTRVN